MLDTRITILYLHIGAQDSKRAVDRQTGRHISQNYKGSYFRLWNPKDVTALGKQSVADCSQSQLAISHANHRLRALLLTASV